VNILKGWGNLKLGVRLIAGFLIVIILAGVVGIVGINATSSVQKSAAIVNDSDALHETLLEARRAEKNWIMRGDEKYLTEVKTFVEEGQALADSIAGEFENEEVAKECDVIDENLDEYYATFLDYVAKAEENNVSLTEWTKIGADFNDVVAQIREETPKGGDVYLQADKLEVTFGLMRVAAIYFIKDRSEARWEAFSQAMLNTKAENKILAEMVAGNTELTAATTAIDNNINQYIEQSGYYHENVLAQNADEARWNNITSTMEGSAEKGNEFYGGSALINALAKQEMESTQKSSMVMVIAFIAASVVLGLLIAITTMRGITKPVNKVKEALKKIAIGDLSEKLDVKSKDEVGEMSQSYNEVQASLSQLAGAADQIARGDLTLEAKARGENDILGKAFVGMANNLKQLVRKVQENALSMASASEQLASASEQSGSATEQIASVSQQVAKGAEEQTKGIGEVNNAIGELGKAIEMVDGGSKEQSKAVEQATGIVQQVSSAAEQTATSAQEAATSASQAAEVAKQGSSTVEKTIEGIRKINASMQDVANKVAELGKHSEEIGGMIATIDDIASQTNLLALNAAIEAARAGEQGRGFAVVADEVKKLAERTAKETKEIAALVGTVQKGVSDSIQASMEGAKQAEAGSSLANEAGMALGQILESINSMTSQIESISAAAEEMSASAQEMVKVVDGVSKIAEQNLGATKKMADSKTKVSESTSTVAATIEENSAATEQMSASAQEMSAQVQQVVASSQSLSKMAADLKQAVNTFKLTNEDNAVSRSTVKEYSDAGQTTGNGKKTKIEAKNTVKV